MTEQTPSLEILRNFVLRACANAEENGYPLDDDNEQEALDILATDGDVAALIENEAVEKITSFIAEYKAGR